ncbi:MAG: hypothetical protein AAGJ74_08595 [Pseudomonadota bacterium]
MRHAFLGIALALWPPSSSAITLADTCNLETKFDPGLFACLINADCKLSEAYPAEAAGSAALYKAARKEIMDHLAKAASCMAYDELVESSRVPADDCLTGNTYLGGALLSMTIAGEITATHPKDMPASSFALAELGPCK